MYCNSGCNPFGCNNGVAPIYAPKKVCTSCSNQYVEQPVICPIECRHINNIVYYPRYYPRYEQTYMTQSAGNPYNANSTFNANDPYNTNNAYNNGYGDYSNSSNNGFASNVMNGSCGCGTNR